MFGAHLPQYPASRPQRCVKGASPPKKGHEGMVQAVCGAPGKTKNVICVFCVRFFKNLFPGPTFPPAPTTFPPTSVEAPTPPGRTGPLRPPARPATPRGSTRRTSRSTRPLSRCRQSPEEGRRKERTRTRGSPSRGSSSGSGSSSSSNSSRRSSRAGRRRRAQRPRPTPRSSGARWTSWTKRASW